MQDIALKISYYALPLLMAITFHEFCHGWAAYKLGDNTAKAMGRLTLNPFAHIDPFFTVLLPLMLIAINSPFVFGMAKPVPVNPANFRRIYRDNALVSVAGPLANLTLAILFRILESALLSGALTFLGAYQSFFLVIAKIGIGINIALFAFNLFPAPPLDGYHILLPLLPRRLRLSVEKIEPYGFYIFLGLMFFGVFDRYLRLVFYLIGGFFA